MSDTDPWNWYNDDNWATQDDAHRVTFGEETHEPTNSE